MGNALTLEVPDDGKQLCCVVSDDKLFFLFEVGSFMNQVDQS